MAYRVTDYGMDGGSINGGWRSDAACRTADPDLFFPVGQANRDFLEYKALEVCRACPVRAKCTSWAVENAVLDGVWGVPESELTAMVRVRHGGRVAAPGRHELCANDHAMTEDNTYTDKQGKRSCRMCRRVRIEARRRNLRTVMAS
jgi:WhiB family redox-sensing transcriptional regulator